MTSMRELSMRKQARFEYSIETAYYDYSAWCRPNDMGIFNEDDRVEVSSDDCRDDWVS